jgi:uncharacterized protein DUF4190
LALGSDGYMNDPNGYHVFALITLGIFGVPSMVCGIAAAITGHRALSRIKQSGGALYGHGAALTGLILGYIDLGPSIILGLLAAIFHFAG